MAVEHAWLQVSFLDAMLHNADWTRAVIGEHPSLLHESPVHALAMMGSKIVTGCKDGKVTIWENNKVQPASVCLEATMQTNHDYCQ